MYASNAFDAANARTFGQGSDYRYLLVGAEYVCHEIKCITQCRTCQELSVIQFVAMKLLALTVLLAVMQAPAPIPRKAADPQTGATQNVTGNAERNQSPSDIVAPLKEQTEPAQTQDKGQSPTDANAEQTIVIRESAPVPKAGKDRWDKAYVIFTGALVIIGFVGVGCAVVTLWAIRAQVTVMTEQRQVMLGQLRTMQEQITEMSAQTAVAKENADTARDSVKVQAQTVILQYRPKIVVRNAKVLNFSFDLGKPWECEIRFQAVNTGGSAAYITADSNIQIVSSLGYDIGKIETKWGDPRPLSSATLGPGQGMTVEESLHTGVIFDLDWENFHQGLKTDPLRFMHLTGVIYYTDDLGIPRSTGIDRAFDAKTGNFIPLKETEQEYTD